MVVSFNILSTSSAKIITAFIWSASVPFVFSFIQFCVKTAPVRLSTLDGAKPSISNPIPFSLMLQIKSNLTAKLSAFKTAITW
jgi:hypothetical protein